MYVKVRHVHIVYMMYNFANVVLCFWYSELECKMKLILYAIWSTSKMKTLTQKLHSLAIMCYTSFVSILAGLF